MWHKMREIVINSFPKPNTQTVNIDNCIKDIDVIYKDDAYNSLSIEGYKVTDELIKKVKSGKWNPDNNATDFEQRNVMAARGYWQAFQAVKKSVKKILTKGNLGEVLETDHKIWYQELFAPSTVAGLLKPADLVGYRTHQVYIRSSMHTPLSPEAVRDAMPALFDLLKKESNGAVRTVLGHFFFVYIHPYMDGNGRIGRFIMNSMFVTGGYKWTIVPVEKRSEYMSALEKASVVGDILDFTNFIASLL
jgi:fido (protein-threonine AMPylation protein)